MRLYKFISRNEDTFKKAHAIGAISSKLILQYRIYQDYQAHYKSKSKNIKKSDIYQWLADDYKVSVRTIRGAISAMKRNI